MVVVDVVVVGRCLRERGGKKREKKIKREEGGERREEKLII